MLVAVSGAWFRWMGVRRRAETLSDEKQTLLEQTHADATTDALTGMGNRRMLFSDTERLLAGLPEGGVLSLGIFDLNGFKGYNDSFGHPAGDVLLALLGRKVTAAMRGRGTAYRMGGDEFCVVTVSTDAASVHATAAAALSEQGETFAISCSYGSVEIPREASTLESALQIADRRLYGHKDQTRSTQSVQVRDALIEMLSAQGGELTSHLARVAAMAGETAAHLGLPVDEIARIRLAADLHDIGKAAISLSPLGAADSTPHESVIGEQILAAAPALADAAPIVRATTERPDGTGYPDGLLLDEIPMGSRVIAVADAFDVIVRGRSQLERAAIAAACDELVRGAGTRFDEEVVRAFLEIVGEPTWRMPGPDAKAGRPTVRETARVAVT
jgi:two-component system cell cycle response regulator